MIFFVMLLPLACSFCKKKAKEFALQSDSFVIFTKSIAPKHFLCKDFFCNSFGLDGTCQKELMPNNFRGASVSFVNS